MKTLLVSYDLGLPETYNDYVILRDYLKSFPGWAKPLQSLWIIKADVTVSAVRDEIKKRIDSNDKVLVIDITGMSWATTGVAKNVTDWMHQNYK